MPTASAASVCVTPAAVRKCRVPRAARDQAGMARPGTPPGLRLPVQVRDTRVPRLHRAGEADRAGDRRGVPHAGLESADPRGEGRLPAVAGRLGGGRRAAGKPDQRRHEPGGAGRPGAIAARLRAGAVPRGGRRRDPRRPRVAGQPLRRQRDRRGPAPGAGHAGRRAPAPQRRAGRHRRRDPARWLEDQVASLGT